MSTPSFRLSFEPRHGEAVDVTPPGCPVRIRRIVADNPSPFTFHGTNTYLVGERELALIDPGPLGAAHEKAIESAVDGAVVSRILVTHTHVDHSPLARVLSAKWDVPCVAEGPHRPARPLRAGEENPLDASADNDFHPDVAVGDNDVVDGAEWSFRTIPTPGHTANHTAFALRTARGGETDIIFSGDHVMAWSTTIVAPPDGSMRQYMASLDRMLEEPHGLYLPGHGGRLENATSFVRALKAHRKMREQAILERVRKGDRTVQDMVRTIYATTDPKLHGAAGLSVLAHLEDLAERGEVLADGPASLDARYEMA